MDKIGLDLGYGHTKVVAENGNRICFPSLAVKGKKLKMDDMLGAADDYIATINDNTWYVGKMAVKENRFAIRAFDDNERFNNEAFQAMLATALSVTSQNNEDLCVVTGLPLAAYRDSTDKFRSFLEDFTAQTEIDNVTKNIAIKSAYIFPQAAGIFVNPYCSDIKNNLSPGSLVSVIDIGYRTTDIAVFEYIDGKYQLLLGNSFTIDTGMSSIFHALGDIMAQKAGTFEVTPEEAEKAFNSGHGYTKDGPVEYSKEIAELKKITVNRLVDAYNTKGPNTAQQNVILLAGGGSIPLQKELIGAFPNAKTIPDAQFANAVGFLEVAKTLATPILN